MPPIFTTLSLTQAYSILTTSILGVLSINGISVIKIQAVLAAKYFDVPQSYFQFIIGNNLETTRGGDVYVNEPLEVDVMNEVSYFILFYDANGVGTYTFV